MTRDSGLPRPMRRRAKGTQPDRQLRARADRGTLPEKLPLIHITATGFAKEIVEAGQLEVRQCGVFRKDLVYFFVLRPAYSLKGGDEKSERINRFPFAFVLKADAVPNPYHVYPFDSGGAALGVFSDQADEYVCLEDFELESTQTAAAGHIGWAFGTLDDYFEGNLRGGLTDDVPAHETVTLAWQAIAGMARTGSNDFNPDKRASAVEVASARNVPLKGNVLLAVIPKQYLDDDGRKNVAFIDRLTELGIPWKTYEWQPNSVPNEMREEISRVVRKYLTPDYLRGQ